MRTESAYATKGRGSGGISKQKIPRQGTKIRELWDLFQNKRGEVVIFPLNTLYNKSVLNALTDFYGLDIRCLSHKSAGRGKGSCPGQWILAGEWFGNEYKDYIAEKRKNIAKIEAILTEEPKP
jgi:hypothetical protein